MKWAASDGNPLGQRCCATSAEQWDSSPKSVLLKEKNRAPGIREQPVTGGNESAYSEYGAGVRTPTFDPGVLNRRVPSNAPCGSVRFLCQLGHVCKKRVRLADEQTHVS